MASLVRASEFATVVVTLVARVFLPQSCCVFQPWRQSRIGFMDTAVVTPILAMLEIQVPFVVCSRVF